MALVLRALAAFVSVGLAASSLAGCSSNDVAPAATPSTPPTASPTNQPAVNLNKMLLVTPAWATTRLTDGRIDAVRASEKISLQGRDSVARRLTNLAYVTGVYRGWSGSGTTVEILLMQYLDGAGADACVSYLLELRGTTANPVDGIDNGGWTADDDGRGIQVFFRRGAIVVRMVITTMTELDVDRYLYLPAEQYAKLPAE